MLPGDKDDVTSSAAPKSYKLLSGADNSFGRQIRPVLFLVFIFLINFTARVVLSPLLPVIEQELEVSHARAGSLFFFTSVGYLLGLLSSGIFASRLTHRRIIVVSSAGVGITLLAVSAAPGLWSICTALFGVGFAAGLYMPSAIATITSVVDRRHWGKAIAVHELAPNLAFFISPFVAELFLPWPGWRGAMGFLALLSFAASFSFGRLVKGGDFSGEPPGAVVFAALLRTPSFWLMIVLFGLGVSSTIGIYAMLPLYLITERHITPSWANTLVALSRAHGPILGLVGGWASDKLGAKQTIVISLGFTGILTILVGSLTDFWLSAAVLLQPLLAVWFFPAAFAAVAMITSSRARNVAVSLSVPFGFIIGGGLVPVFIGYTGDAGSFAVGIVLTGAVIAGGGILALLLKSSENGASSR